MVARRTSGEGVPARWRHRRCGCEEVLPVTRSLSPVLRFRRERNQRRGGTCRVLTAAGNDQFASDMAAPDTSAVGISGRHPLQRRSRLDAATHARWRPPLSNAAASARGRGSQYRLRPGVLRVAQCGIAARAKVGAQTRPSAVEESDHIQRVEAPGGASIAARRTCPADRVPTLTTRAQPSRLTSRSIAARCPDPRISIVERRISGGSASPRRGGRAPWRRPRAPPALN